MLDWFSSFWTDYSLYGPARNAPNNGINIKDLLQQRPQRVICLTPEEVQHKLSTLRPTKINAIPPIQNKNPIMKEFDEVFNQGYQNYFIERKLKLQKYNNA